MNSILDDSLYCRNEEHYLEIRNEARKFNLLFNGMNIVQDNIFSIIRNYGKREGYMIETLRYPVSDREFCACTFVLKGTIFVFVNSYIPLSEQIFASAHELFHIIRYIDGKDTAFSSRGSILKASSVDETISVKEDMEADSFASVFLVPSDFLLQQAEIYSIHKDRIQLRDILKLMDIFAVPFKPMVLRLYEDNFMNERKADDFLSLDSSVIEEEIQLSGISKRWQKTTPDLMEFGSLLEQMTINERMGYATESRIEEDRKTVEQIRMKLQM